MSNSFVEETAFALKVNLFERPYSQNPSKLSVSEILKKLKGRSSRLLQKDFPHLKKRYWGQRFWATGYGAWSTGNITDEMMQEYLEQHRKPSDKSQDNFLHE